MFKYEEKGDIVINEHYVNKGDKMATNKRIKSDEEIAKYTKSYSRAAWALFFITIFTVLITSGLLIYNIMWIGTAKKQLQSSIKPNLDIIFSQDTVKIINSGLPDISDLSVWPIIFITNKEDSLIMMSVSNYPMYKIKNLNSGYSVITLKDTLLPPGYSHLKGEWKFGYIALSFIYHRDVDKKKYLIIKPFIIENNDIYRALFAEQGFAYAIPLNAKYEKLFPVMKTNVEKYFNIE